MNTGTTKRIFRGSAVTWFRLLVTILSQLITTPVFLAYWSADLYGVWLALIAAVSLFQLPGLSHQDFAGYELLRYGTKRSRVFSKIIYSAIQAGVVYGIIEFLAALSIAFLFVRTPLAPEITGGATKHEIAVSFVIMVSISGLVWNWGGMWVRAATAMGEYERCTWWSIGDALVRALVPLIVVPLGAELVGTAAVMTICLLILYTLTLTDLIRTISHRLRKKVRQNRWNYGAKQFLIAQALSLRSLMEAGRQQGVRLLLAPIAGTAEMAAFATSRTGANAAVQGLGTITNPIMPELMRFLNHRDQDRVDAALGIIWLMVVGPMALTVVLIQVIAPHLFAYWTQGKFAFDPILFSIFSLCVLIYAAAQPAAAVVQGNNLLRSQLVVSAVAASVVLIGVCYFAPEHGIRGAAAVLLGAEVCAAGGYVVRAQWWMRKNGLKWPSNAFSRVIMAIIVTTLCLISFISFPSLQVLILIIGIMAQLLCAWSYWNRLPRLARTRAGQLWQFVRQIRLRWTPKFL